MIKRLIVDLSSLCWTYLLKGRDEEFGREVEHEGRKVYINSAAFAREQAITLLVSSWKRFDIQPINTIMVIEGANSKGLRKSFLPDYKGNRDSRPEEAYAEFNKLKEWLCEDVRSLGGTSCRQDVGGVEGDDVIAYLCENFEGENVILSNDGDLSRLVKPGTQLFRQGEICGNPYGPFLAKHITVYKGLVGDSSDKIPGAKGFGPKAFLDLACIFGDDGLDLMEELILNRKLPTLLEDVGSLKALQKVVDNADTVYRSYAAAKLYPEHINTMRKPLTWQPGYVKQASEIEDDRLKPYAGQIRLITAANYEEAYRWAKGQIEASPFVSLDIETSTPEESDDWLRLNKRGGSGDDLGVDVFGSKLTGMGLTFGPNNQYTFYFSVDHADTENVTSEQVRQFVRLVPPGMSIKVQNNAFELPILYLEWGAKQVDNGWYGFLPDVEDTKLMASYVNENISSGLKQSSKHYFGYEQTSYDEVTGGKKMNQLPATQVLAYGADDTIMTSALWNHYRRIMEIEHSWDAFVATEIKSSYLVALSFVHGAQISLERMFELEREDDEEAAKQMLVVNDYLINIGWEGTRCPVFDGESLATPAGIKLAYATILDRELKTMVRTPSKLHALIASEDDEDAKLLSHYLAEGNLDQINDWAARRFDGAPILDLGSAKQIKQLLYGTMGFPVRIINKLTDKEREFDKPLAKAVWAFNKIQRGSTTTELTDEQRLLLVKKASTDETAIAMALLEDAEGENKAMLEALQTLKKIQTRKSMFYGPYHHVQHWKDGLVHGHEGQCATVTRRFAPSKPNKSQLPKKGEGVKFREIYVPHKRNAVVCSIDFGGQELRLGADQSKDKNMLSCYVGDNLKDLHTMTAAGAMRTKWGAGEVSRLAAKYSLPEATDADLIELLTHLQKHGDAVDQKEGKDLRKDAKPINFGANYDAGALTIALKAQIPVAEAQMFLDAKYAMFPRFEEWKQDVKDELHKTGFLTTYLGARRHLADAVMADDKWEVQKAERQGPNFKIQGSAAEQTKIAMGRMWDAGIFFKYDARFIAPVHDECVTSVIDAHAVDFIRIKHWCMVQPYMEEVPVVGSISVGPNFGKQTECGDEFDAAAIQKAIDEIRNRDLVAA